MCFALFAWFARTVLLAGIAKTATGKAWNEWKTLGKLGVVVFKCSDTNVVFQTAIFLILVIRNKEGPPALTVKPATAFSEVVYITVIVSYIFDRNCSLNL